MSSKYEEGNLRKASDKLRKQDGRSEEEQSASQSDDNNAMSPDTDATDSSPAQLDQTAQVTIHRPLRRMTQRVGDPLHMSAVIHPMPHTAGDDTPPVLPTVPPCTPVAGKSILQFASLMPLTIVKPLETSQASSIPAAQRSPTLKHCSYNLQDHKHHMQVAALHDDLLPKMGKGKVGEMWVGQRGGSEANKAGDEGGTSSNEEEPERWKGYGYSSGRGTPVFWS